VSLKELGAAKGTRGENGKVDDFEKIPARGTPLMASWTMYTLVSSYLVGRTNRGA